MTRNCKWQSMENTSQGSSDPIFTEGGVKYLLYIIPVSVVPVASCTALICKTSTGQAIGNAIMAAHIQNFLFSKCCTKTTIPPAPQRGR